MTNDIRLFIRPGMDVYSARQDRYIGAVIRVIHGTAAGSGGGQAKAPARGAAPGNASLVHEEGNVAGHGEARGRRMLGEEMGPVPTLGLGNTGPTRQSAGGEYATGVRDGGPDVSHFLVRPGRMNLGPLTRAITIPATAVLSVSLERIVVDWE